MSLCWPTKCVSMKLKSRNEQRDMVADRGRPHPLASMTVNASVFEGTAEKNSWAYSYHFR